MNHKRTLLAQVVNDAPSELSLVIGIMFALEWNGTKIVIRDHVQFVLVFLATYFLLKLVFRFVAAFLFPQFQKKDQQ